MNKDEAIAAVLSKALEVAQTTGNFVVEQTPDVINQLVAYNTALYTAGLVTGIALAITCAICFYKAVRSYCESYLTVSILTGFGALPFTIVNTILLLKITLAPKAWLLDYAASLIK